MVLITELPFWGSGEDLIPPLALICSITGKGHTASSWLHQARTPPSSPNPGSTCHTTTSLREDCDLMQMSLLCLLELLCCLWATKGDGGGEGKMAEILLANGRVNL